MEATCSMVCCMEKNVGEMEELPRYTNAGVWSYWLTVSPGLIVCRRKALKGS